MQNSNVAWKQKKAVWPKPFSSRRNNYLEMPMFNDTEIAERPEKILRKLNRTIKLSGRFFGAEGGPTTRAREERARTFAYLVRHDDAVRDWSFVVSLYEQHVGVRSAPALRSQMGLISSLIALNRFEEAEVVYVRMKAALQRLDESESRNNSIKTIDDTLEMIASWRLYRQSGSS